MLKNLWKIKWILRNDILGIDGLLSCILYWIKLIACSIFWNICWTCNDDHLWCLRYVRCFIFTFQTCLAKLWTVQTIKILDFHRPPDHRYGFVRSSPWSEISVRILVRVSKMMENPVRILKLQKCPELYQSHKTVQKCKYCIIVIRILTSIFW